LSSLEPEHCSEEILELFSHPRMCPHLHLPLQSGSDAVLASMSRKYGSPGYRGVVGSFRRRAPFGAVTTDVMVG